MKIPSFVTASAIAVTALALTACGSSNDSSSANTVPPDAGLVVDAGPGIKFDKSDYTATAGSVKVALVNHDSQAHTLDIIASNGTKLPGELRVGKSGDIDVGTYDLPAGTYQVVCLIPGHDNMKSTLTVS